MGKGRKLEGEFARFFATLNGMIAWKVLIILYRETEQKIRWNSRLAIHDDQHDGWSRGWKYRLTDLPQYYSNPFHAYLNLNVIWWPQISSHEIQITLFFFLSPVLLNQRNVQ